VCGGDEGEAAQHDATEMSAAESDIILSCSTYAAVITSLN
jgi:hypothetical protein